MMQNEQLVAADGELSVRSAFVVAELDLIGVVEQFHNCANLPADQSMFRQIRK
jgi:hypothetical protein